MRQSRRLVWMRARRRSKPRSSPNPRVGAIPSGADHSPMRTGGVPVIQRGTGSSTARRLSYRSCALRDGIPTWTHPRLRLRVVQSRVPRVSFLKGVRVRSGSPLMVKTSALPAVRLPPRPHGHNHQELLAPSSSTKGSGSVSSFRDMIP